METTMILEKSELFNRIKELINEEVNNADLRREIVAIFEAKKLNQNAIVCVFNNTVKIEELETMEQIAIAKGCWLFSKEIEYYNYKKYFSAKSISDFNSYVAIEKPLNVMKFENAVKIADDLYRVNKSYTDIAKFKEQMLMIYNVDTQREPAYEKIGNKMVRVPAIDRKTVKDIKEAILNGTFEDTEIILNVKLVEGKIPNFDFIPKYKDILGDIEIKPQYTDLDDIRYTVVNILDGYHRILAIQAAVQEYYQKTGEELQGSIGVKIVFADEERALRIVEQTFKRSETNKQFLDAMKVTDYSILTDAIIKNAKELGHVAKTYEEAIALKRKSYKVIMTKTIEHLKIEAVGIADRNFKSKRFGKIINDYYFILETELKKNNKYDEIMNILEHPNFSSAIICYANSIINKGEEADYEAFEFLADYVLENYQTKEFEKMKLMNKNCNIAKINEFFGGGNK